MRVSLILPIVMAFQLGGSPAGASEKWSESKEPVYAQPESGRALVYVVRDKVPGPLLGTFEVFLDDVPLGFLKGRKYLHAQAEPGPRLLWGPKKGHPVFRSTWRPGVRMCSGSRSPGKFVTRRPEETFS